MRKKILTLIMTGLLLLTSFFNATPVKATDEGGEQTSRIITISTHSDGTNEKGEYLSNEQIQFYVRLNLSSLINEVEGSKLVVTIPKAFIGKDTVEYIDIEEASSVELTEDDTHYSITYTLASVGSAGSLSIPFTIITHYGNTPDGYSFDIDVTLLNDENEVSDSAIKSLTIRTIQPSLLKSIDETAWEWRDGQVVPGGLVDENDSTRLTTDLDKLKVVAFSYLFSRYANTGNRYYTKINIEDILPEDAVFIQELNDGWVYDETTRVARFEYALDTPSLLTHNQYDTVLRLKFPGGVLDQNYENTAHVELIPYEQAEYEITPVISDTIKFKLKANLTHRIEKSTTEPILDLPSHKSNEVRWNVSLTSDIDLEREDTRLYDFSIVDFDLDENLEYTRLVIPVISDVFIGTYTIRADYGTGPAVVLLNQSGSVTATAQFASGAQEIIFEADEGSYLKGGSKTLNLVVYSKFKDPSKNILQETERLKGLNNYGKLIWEEDDGSTSDQTVTATLNVKKPESKAYIKKTIVNENGTLVPTENRRFVKGSTINYKLEIFVNDVMNEVELQTNVLIDLLPPGSTYVANSTKLNNTNKTFTMNTDNWIDEPNQILNYKGSGRTALVWNLGTISAKKVKLNTWYAPYNITYATIVTDQTEEGVNENQSILSWTNNDQVLAHEEVHSIIVDDVYDLNANNSTVDKISQSNIEFQYLPPKALFIQKSVKGDLDSDFVKAPNVGFTEVDGNAVFRINLRNFSDDSFEELTLIDVLPTLDDRTVARNAANERVNRNSTFSVTLAQYLQPSEKFDIYYTTVPPGEDMHEYMNNTIWSETVENLEEVVALKIVLKQAHTLHENDEVIFDIPVKVPNDPQLTANDIAVNSVGLLVSDSEDFLESNMSSLSIPEFTVDGYAFIDEDKDGVFDETTQDKAVKNHRVTLVKEDGVQALDDQGFPLYATTNDSGYYSFTVNQSGDYSVKIERLEKYNVTIEAAGDKGCNVTEGTESLTSSLFSLNVENPTSRVNAGFVADTPVSLILRKHVLNELEEVVVGPQFNFEIRINDTLYNGVANLTTSEYSYPINITDGQVLLATGEYVEIENLARNSTYSITEDEEDNYRTNPESRNLSGTLIEDVTDLEFVNTYVVPMTNLHIEKEWIGGPLPRPDITVQIYRDTEAYLEPITISNGEPQYIVENLPLTDEFGVQYTYTIEEIDVPDNYLSDVSEFKITNTYFSPTIDITMTKEWVGGPDDHPAIEVQLYQNDVAYGEPVMIEDGIVMYTWFDLDETDLEGQAYRYTVKEVNPPENYVDTVEGYTITNTYVSPTLDITMTKEWVGGPDDHPVIEVQLYQNDVAFGEPVMIEDGIVMYTWFDLDETDLQGQAYRYTVKEVNPPENYVDTVEGYTITNTYVSPTLDITMTKVWVGGPGTHPSIHIQLMRDGIALGNPVLLVNGVETYTWFNLDQTDAYGNNYSYTVDELNTPTLYRKHINQFTITNTYMPPVTPGPILPDTGNITTVQTQTVSPSLPETGTPQEARVFFGGIAVLSGIGLMVLARKRNKKQDHDEDKEEEE